MAKQTPRTINTELRRNRVLQLRMDGASYRQIADPDPGEVACAWPGWPTWTPTPRPRVRTEGEEIAQLVPCASALTLRGAARSPRSREREVEERYEDVEPDPTDPAGQRTRKVWRTRKIRIPPDPKATELVVRTLQAVDLLLGIRIPQPEEVFPPEPIELSIQLIPTGALEQIEDNHDDVTDVESEEVEDGRP